MRVNEDRYGQQYVALRKESVDRNFYYSDKDADWVRSLSARRAWIEIRMALFLAPPTMSLSARRAWIEISDSWGALHQLPRRSPQGERG